MHDELVRAVLAASPMASAVGKPKLRGNHLEFMDIIHARRSTRAYTDEQVSNEELAAIVEAGRTAPIAGADFSMSHMTVVQDPSLITEIREACQLTRKDGTKADPTYGAPTLIFMSANGPSDDMIEYSNVACAIENMALAATSLGLGSVYLWGFLRKLRARPDVVGKLGLPEGYTILSAFAVGHATEPVEPHEPKGRIAVDYL